MFVALYYIQHFLNEYICYLYPSQILGPLLTFENFSNDFSLRSCITSIGLVFLTHTHHPHTYTYTYKRTHTHQHDNSFHRIHTYHCISVFVP